MIVEEWLEQRVNKLLQDGTHRHSFLFVGAKNPYGINSDWSPGFYAAWKGNGYNVRVIREIHKELAVALLSKDRFVRGIAEEIVKDPLREVSSLFIYKK